MPAGRDGAEKKVYGGQMGCMVFCGEPKKLKLGLSGRSACRDGAGCCGHVVVGGCRATKGTR